MQPSTKVYPVVKNPSVILALITLIGFGIIGIFLLNSSHAATASIALEAEKGLMTAPAKTTADATASDGLAITFAKGGVTTPVSSANPCVGTSAPTAWKHVVVLLFENKRYTDVIGSSSAPYISKLATQCGTYASWQDANFKVNGTTDGAYVSKPNYATLTSGVPPTVHGLKDDAYGTTSGVDNIFNRLLKSGKMAKSYVAGTGGSCAVSNFSGAYHDPMRYYTNLGAQSASPGSLCNQNDVPITQFMSDVNAGHLPAYSFILPTNQQNMHDNTISSGDSWAKAFLTPLLDSAQYKSGDTAIFFLWDEDAPIPNVLLAPSIKPGSKPVRPAGANPISHFSALRTWQEMLGVSPLLGNTSQAPSLLNYYNGR